MTMKQKALAQTLMHTLNSVEKQMDKESSELDKKIQNLSIDEVREKRKQFLKMKNKKNQEYLAKGHGSYIEVTDTKQFFNLCKESDRVVVQFYRGTTKRCEIIDRHFEILCKEHLETRFMKVNVEKHSYLCEKLNIVFLPSIVVVLNGTTEKTFRGFEEFGNFDDFKTATLEEKLKEAGALQSATLEQDFLTSSADKENEEEVNRTKVRQSKLCVADSDDDW